MTTCTPTTRNVTKWFRAATPDDYATGMAWYPEGMAMATRWADAYGLTPLQCLALLALTSSRNGWEPNCRLAEKIARTRDTSRGYLGKMLAKCQRVLDGDDPFTVCDSLKHANFFLSFIGSDPMAACIDRHAWDVATDQRHRDDATKGDPSLPVRPALSGKRYEAAAECYRRAAAILSRERGITITAWQVQAVTWVAWRNALKAS